MTRFIDKRNNCILENRTVFPILDPKYFLLRRHEKKIPNALNSWLRCDIDLVCPSRSFCGKQKSIDSLESAAKQRCILIDSAAFYGQKCGGWANWCPSSSPLYSWTLIYGRLFSPKLWPTNFLCSPYIFVRSLFRLSTRKRMNGHANCRTMKSATRFQLWPAFGKSRESLFSHSN